MTRKLNRKLLKRVSLLLLFVFFVFPATVLTEMPPVSCSERVARNFSSLGTGVEVRGEGGHAKLHTLNLRRRL